MIKIDNEYILNANETCYTLEKISVVQDKESKNYGNEVKTTKGYYSSLESALNGYIREKTRKYISKSEMNTLNELLSEISKLKDELKEKFEMV